MIKDLQCSEQLKQNLKNELKNPKESGTYIFYGSNKNNLMEIAISLAKGLNCLEETDDFCDSCSSCIRINSKTHGDLEILKDDSGIKIDKIRDIILKSSVSSYEGGKKIFILEDINRIRVASGNALLKTIEESPKGNYFFLLTTSLDILPTIKSRGTLIKVSNLTPNELGVSSLVFKYFNGNSQDILKYKERHLDLDIVSNYDEIGNYLTNYYESNKDIEWKIRIYNAINGFVTNYKWISELEKLKFIEDIVRNCKEKEEVLLILNYIGTLRREEINLNKILESKFKLLNPVILKGLLMDVFL